MHNPVIRGVTHSPDPIVVPHGGLVTFDIDAFDPGQIVVNYTVEVTNQDGGVSQFALPPGQVGGIKTYAVVPSAGIVEQDPTNPARFIWTAPPEVPDPPPP